ncbi:hypothetical protein B6N60_04390 [Richelia sinica FACHB-800]|uniref:Uncharacterized protein n=1 Tax=Richelia sinica FACHB-800 TaxID=1357546 RepID=A0A975TBZ7_9NOST|nr:hypothetical protein B6N60_04390 [Richelia sinica FACHB-800]
MRSHSLHPQKAIAFPKPQNSDLLKAAALRYRTSSTSLKAIPLVSYLYETLRER